MIEADYVIVGAGTAGCVLARRLLDRTGARVLLVEAGGHDWVPAIQDPARMHELWDGPQDWGLRTVPQRHAADRRLHLPRGRVVGGSHALNAMIYVRGNPADYDGWGVPGWSWPEVEPLFERIESGPLPITRPSVVDPIQADIVAAAQQCGLPFNSDYNDGDQSGVSFMQFTIADGQRCTTARAYLEPVFDHPNLMVLTGVEVHRLLFDGNRCVGLQLLQDEVRATTEVILCAGAIGSPVLLLKSGIGPVADPVVDLPEVGRNLQDHWLVPTIFSADRQITHTPGLPHTQTHLFWRDLQPVHFSVPLYPQGMTGPDNAFSLMAGLVRPASSGRITIGAEGPLIDPGVLSADSDVDALAEAVRLCQRIGGAPALQAWGATELYPGNADLVDYIRKSVVTYHHQAGTCAIGGVVDPSLRVHGVTGLRVADASVMPTITTGNTNAPTMMIAEKAADLITSSNAAGNDRLSAEAEQTLPQQASEGRERSW